MAVTAKRITMKDIAAKVGVTQQSVSEVLTNNPKSRISPDTRKRIMTAARELKYRPNYLASSLKKGKTDTIGFLGERIARDSRAITVNNLTAAGIEQALPDDKSFIIFSSNGDRGVEKSINLARQGIVDGLIIQVFPHHYAELEQTIIPALQEIGLPFVVAHPTGQMLPCSHVGINRVRAGYLAARDLLERGIDDICVYNVWPDRPGAQETACGVEQAFRERGKVFGAGNSVIPPDVQPGELVHSFLPRNLKSLTRIPRAFIFTHSTAAGLAAEFFLAGGLRIPEDIYITCFGLPDTRDFPVESVDVYGVALEEQGKAATDMLLQLIDAGDDGRESVYRLLEPHRL